MTAERQSKRDRLSAAIQQFNEVSDGAGQAELSAQHSGDAPDSLVVLCPLSSVQAVAHINMPSDVNAAAVIDVSAIINRPFASDVLLALSEDLAEVALLASFLTDRHRNSGTRRED